jgi:DNA processing protein
VTDKDAYIILNLIPGIGSVKIKELISIFSSPTNLLNASEQELDKIKGINKNIKETLSNWKTTIDYKHELELAEKGGVKIITLADEDYPQSLKEIYDPPICLYIRGSLNANTEKNIAIVGSRRITRYGKDAAKHLATAAANTGWCVISGLAYGIDATAHQAVVDTKGQTIAVLGGGLARIHPQDHIPLAREILQNGGAIVSEFPMEFTPTRWSFPMRNRIISGLSQGLIVIEAGLKSGSLITARCALEQGRSVFAVPGEIDNPQAKGTNQLIKNGAKLTESFDDILEEFSFITNKDTRTPKQVPEEEYSNLTELELKIFEELKQGSLSADNISLACAIPAGATLATLMQMQLKNIIIPLPGKKYELKKHM